MPSTDVDSPVNGVDHSGRMAAEAVVEKMLLIPYKYLVLTLRKLQETCKHRCMRKLNQAMRRNRYFSQMGGKNKDNENKTHVLSGIDHHDQLVLRLCRRFVSFTIRSSRFHMSTAFFFNGRIRNSLMTE